MRDFLRIADSKPVCHEPAAMFFAATIGTDVRASMGGKSCLTIDLNHLLKITSGDSRGVSQGADSF